jgi:D-inositol-3-phosphate glycosyltransferase
MQQDWGDARPSDRAGPRRVGLLSVHTSPLEQPGTGDSGGMNVYLLSLAERLAAAGVGVDIFTRAAGRDLPATVTTAHGVAVHHLEAGPPGLAKDYLASHLCAFYLALAAHPATADLDLLHGHYWMSGWVGRLAARRLGLPLVQSFHTLGRVKNDTLAPGDVPEPPLRLAAEERVVADADAILAPASSEIAVLRQRYGAVPRKIHLVEPGVDLDLFSPAIDRHAARQSLGGGRIVLFVGRLQPLKAPDTAVRALAALDALLPSDGVPTRLVIVGGASGNGDGVSDPHSLRRLAAELGVADRVAVLAPRPHAELASLYRAADVVLVPSHSESFGLVALEAQACGTPVVASDVGGLRAAVNGGGTLVASRNPRDFAAALLPYLVDARVRAKAAADAQRHAARFTWTATAQRTLEVYRGVLRQRRATQSASASGASALGTSVPDAEAKGA